MVAKEKAEISKLMRGVLQEDATREAVRQDMHAVMRAEFAELFLDTFEKFATSIQQQFQIIEGEFQKLNQRLDDIDARLTRLEQRVEKLDGQMSQVVGRLDNVDATLTDLGLASRDERAEIQVLKDRLISLEERLARLEGRQHG
jgi:chromosome segregation ATPase